MAGGQVPRTLTTASTASPKLCSKATVQPSAPSVPGSSEIRDARCKQSKRKDEDGRPLRLSIKTNEDKHRREQQMPAPHPTEASIEQHRADRRQIHRCGGRTRHLSCLTREQCYRRDQGDHRGNEQY